MTEHVPGVRSVALGIWIAIGSRDERPDQAGAAHFLEHLLFKGTARRSAMDIAEQLDAVGGELNAFTTKEHTCYYAHVLDEDVPLAVDVLGDVVTHALLAAPDVDLERRVVLEEIAMRDDDPEDLLAELFEETIFTGHPLALPVLGSAGSVEGMSRETLAGFWHEYASPRMVVAAAGNLDHDHLVDLVAKALADAVTPGASPVPPRPGGRRRVPQHPTDVVRDGGIEQVYFMLGVPGVDRHDPRRMVQSVLSTVVGGGLSSRLFQEVREKRGLVYQVASSDSVYSDAAAFSVYAGCAPERFAETLTVVRGVLADVAANGVTEAEVVRAKGSLRGGLVLGLEDTASRMTRLGRSEIDHGRQRTLAESLGRIEAVTPEQVSALAADLLASPLTTTAVGPITDLP